MSREQAVGIKTNPYGSINVNASSKRDWKLVFFFEDGFIYSLIRKKYSVIKFRGLDDEAPNMWKIQHYNQNKKNCLQYTLSEIFIFLNYSHCTLSEIFIFVNCSQCTLSEIFIFLNCLYCTLSEIFFYLNC